MANLTTFFTNKQLHPTKPFNYLINSSFPFHCKSFITSTARYRRKPFKIKCSSSSVKHCSTSDNINMSSEMWAEESEGVQVIGIGSRVDAVLDFCLLHSSTSSHSFRFWSVIKRESLRGELRQRFLREDNYPDFGDTPLNSVSHSKAVVLVASAGYGDDHVLAIEILRAIRSGSGLVVAVVLKPFSFEGQRRQDEVKILTDTLQNCVDFCIDVDIDTLLKMDLVTLDEALKTAYKAVFSAINAVSILVSDSHKKHIHSLHDGMTKVTVADIKKVLDSHKEARIGFGIADNVESSIVQAVYDCPFLSVGLKNLDGVVVCVLSSSSALGDDDVCTVLHSFREATECTKEVIISVVRNPDMKPNLIASTVITIGNTEGKSLQKSSILSRLAGSIPFVFYFLRRHDVESDNPKESSLRKSIFPPMLANFVDKNEVPDMVPAEEATDSFETYSSNKMFVDENNNMVGNLDALGSSSNYMEPTAQGDQTSGGKPFIDREVRPEYKIVERHEEDWSVSVADNPKIFQLPVGVRLSDDSDDKVDRTTPRRPAEKIIDEDSRMQTSTVPSVSSFNEFADVGFEVVTDILNTASTLLKGKQLDVQKKQGVLSVRAASMLEAERDSKTRWSPVMKIRYRGGIYKGHCQGGLPEGRGRLTFQDGSVYDGMWRYGKRSGLGSLFYSNGDVFHGSWRDDLMHGKGWLYFSTGERWFANFWKGRANGEGRFYSKSGEVFFGQFQDGWRDGQFLCVKDYGRRYVEIWNDGVLISSEELDS